MPRYQAVDEIYSALYVDFDNIYTHLAEQDSHAARIFATTPQRWIRWIEGHALRMMYGDGIRRRILKKCCYLDPYRYHEFRPFFIRAAFQVVDCPSSNSQGKTNADIHLVMDCMDALAHTTRFDEIIILSGDADFTPLLLRIQEHARRSLVLSVGYASPAYVAACSWRIREDWFITQALEEAAGEWPDSGRDARCAGNDAGSDGKPEKQDNKNRPAASPPAGKGAGSTPCSTQLPSTRRAQIEESVKRMVEESNAPVPLPSVSQVLQQEFNMPDDWYGAGTVREFLSSLDIAPLGFSHAGQGHVYDPERHQRPEDYCMREMFRSGHPDLYEFALKVHRLTDVPLLRPEDYTRLLTYLVEDITHRGFARTRTIRALEERFEDEDAAITAEEITFVVEAVIRGGLSLTEAGEKLNLETVRTVFKQRVIDLCKLSQLTLDEKGKRLLRDWLGKNH